MVLAGALALAAGIGFRTMQPLSVETVEGAPFHWQDDKWTVVNFFAEWCLPCLREIPELNAFYASGEVRVLGVSFDELDNEQLLGVISRQQIAFPVVQSVAKSSLPVDMPIVLPTTYIVAPDGEVVTTIRGEVTRERLNTALAESRSKVL
ncbi:hypothetical protein GCM10011338_08160 [Alteromonas lipolytica]|uniref:Thioredoxin domain-containing protein n=2 Tax=Alteromonas lipolytica TaxID=1856405 RepID=A0A1E8FIJ1_9ALTE|nr:hypothetical protein BFC17_17270 [Alteromonas lipolytica]GGF58262.1 hypothetical protein GCM10011338_08160 [Alteromonas lipolytica]